MKNILSKVLSIFGSFGSNLSNVILKVCHCIEIVFMYLHDVKRTKDLEKRKQEIKEKSDEIDNVTENGTLDDLFNLKGDR